MATRVFKQKILCIILIGFVGLSWASKTLSAEQNGNSSEHASASGSSGNTGTHGNNPLNAAEEINPAGVAGTKSMFNYSNESTATSELLFQSKNVELYLSGYWQADFGGASTNPGVELPGFANWRAGVTSLELSLYDMWQLVFTYDAHATFFQTNTINFNPNPSYTVVVGQFSPIFGLANTSSTTAITFMELPLPVFAFSPLYELGAFGVWWGDYWSVAASVFGAGSQTKFKGREPMGGIVSVAYSPVHQNTHALHYSLSEWIEETDSTHQTGFLTPPEIVFISYFKDLVKTGGIANVQYDSITDAAFGGVWGPFSVATEYIQTLVPREKGGLLAFEGAYAFGSYFFTGESKLYNFQDLGFAGITPIRHSYGAWELAGRLSYINLDDHDIQGGQEFDASLGLNWYPIRFLEWQLNYVHASAFPSYLGVNQTANIYAMRMELIF